MIDLKKRLIVCIGLFCMFLASLVGPLLCYYSGSILGADIQSTFFFVLFLFVIGLIFGRCIYSRAFLVTGGLLSASCISALLYCGLHYLSNEIDCFSVEFLKVYLGFCCVVYCFVLFTNLIYLLVDYYSITNWLCGIVTVILLIFAAMCCRPFCTTFNMQFSNMMTLYFKFSLFWCLVALTYGYILGDIEHNPTDVNLVLYGLNSIYFGFLYLVGVILVKVLNISTKVGIYISEVVDELQTELGTSGDYVDSGYSYDDGDND